MVYPAGTTLPNTPDVDFVENCNPDLPNVFPLPLRPAFPVGNEVTEKLANFGHLNGQLVLGDAMPNPTAGTSKIPVYIPLTHIGAIILQIFDLTGRAILWQTELNQTGSQLIEVSLKELPPGVYGYSLVDKGKRVGNRKLVIIR